MVIKNNQTKVQELSNLMSINFYKSIRMVGNSILNFIFFTLLSIGFNSTIAQSTILDSLDIALLNATNDSEQIYWMNELSYNLKDVDAKQSLIYAKKALKLSRQTNNKEREIKALHNVGTLVYDSRMRDSAMVYFFEGERMANELGYHKLQADHLMSIANNFRYNQVDSTKAVNYLLKSIEVSKAGNYTYGIARSYAKLASFYTRYKQIEKSEEYLKLSSVYYLKTEDGGDKIAHYYNEVANKIWDFNPRKSMDLYFKGLKLSDTYPNLKVSLARAHSSIGEHEIALTYLKEAIPSLGDRLYIRVKGVAIAQLADVYIELGRNEEALKTCNGGIDFLIQLTESNQSGLPALYRTKGHLMEMAGNNIDAVKFYNKSIDESYRIQAVSERIKSNVALGNFYSRTAPSKAEEYCKKALVSAKSRNLLSLEISACDCLSKVYKQEGLSSKALDYFERKVILSDSLGALKITNALDINSTIVEKDLELAKEFHLKEIKEEQLKSQYRIISILLISSLFGLFLIWFLFSSIKKIRRQNFEITRKTDELEIANKSLGQSNEELERFAHVASHDLKSPLKNIINFTGLLRRILGKDASDSVKEKLGYIEDSGKSMSKLIDDILEYSKLSSLALSENEHEVVVLNDVVDEISNLILNNPEGKLVKIEASSLPSLRWNHSKIFLLFKNLIENGIKYNDSQNPTVKLYFEKKAGVNSVYVQDNGIGIDQKYFDEIFVMFQRLHNQKEYDGTGLGLATCKKIVDEFKGKITIESTVGKGTIFKVDLPEDLLNESVIGRK